MAGWMSDKLQKHKIQAAKSGNAANVQKLGCTMLSSKSTSGPRYDPKVRCTEAFSPSVSRVSRPGTQAGWDSSDQAIINPEWTCSQSNVKTDLKSIDIDGNLSIDFEGFCIRPLVSGSAWNNYLF